MGAITEATQFYRGMFERRGQESLDKIAHVKRFMEFFCGDAGFREAITENHANPQPVAEQYGLAIDPTELLPLWHSEYSQYRRTAEAKKWPLVVLWDDWLADMMKHRDMLTELGRCEEINPAFDAWRMRQQKRCESELGMASSKSITHPIVAFELSDGCSVGCWFCGISAERYRDYQPYTPEVAELWQGMLAHMVDLFGNATQTGFCYWATDPADNPDYPKFIEDYYHVTGALPQTTCAAPLRDLELTQQVLSLFDRYRTVTNRFSIITPKIFKSVMETFSPEELMGVELVHQQKGALGTKAIAGRARTRRLRRQAAGREDNEHYFGEDHSTIACVSGFLVNLLHRRIQLVTPTRADSLWPLGYRVYAERFFTDADDFRAVIEDLIARHMPMRLPMDTVLGFRRDLNYQPIENGFELTTRTHKIWRDQLPFDSALGAMLAENRFTGREIMRKLLQNQADVFFVQRVLQQLFDDGLLNDDPALYGIACDPPLTATQTPLALSGNPS